MEAYRDQYAQLFNGGQDIVLLAVSTDSPESQRHPWLSFGRPLGQPLDAGDLMLYIHASDPDAEVGRLYGAWTESRGGTIDNRTVFLIDPEGIIRWVAAPFREIDPTAYEELGSAIDEIAGSQEPGGN